MPRAFTLIELLVVITIIVVLLALLTPALDKAIASAESAMCMSNLRNWSMAMRQYTMDSRGHTPHTTTAPRDYWWADLAPYMGEPDFAMRTPLGWMKAGVCPVGAIRPGEGTDVPQTLAAVQKWGKWGSAGKGWEWGLVSENPGATAGSYGMNLWLMPHEGQSSGYPREHFFGRYVNVPGDAPLLGDSIWIGGWPNFPQGQAPEDSDLPPADPESGNASADGGWTLGGMMGRWVINRHPMGHMAMNMAFVDGTARNVRLGELWQLQWHSAYRPTRVYAEEYP